VLALPSAPARAPDLAHPDPTPRRASLHWAQLLARLYETRPLACPRCQGEMRLIAFLAHLGEPTVPPPLAPRARAPPDVKAGFAFDFDQSPRGDPTAPAPDPGFTFDQTTA